MKSAGVKDNNDNDNDNNNNEGSRIIPNTGGHTVFNADNDSTDNDSEVDVHCNNSISHGLASIVAKTITAQMIASRR